MNLPKEFDILRFEDLQPYGLMPEGLPRLLPPFGDFDQFKIADQFTYITRTGLIVQSVEDTLTDLASVPWWIKPILDVPGRESAGAVTHDEGYRNPLRPRYNILLRRYELVGKADWDGFFDDINTMAKTKWLKRKMINGGLDVGGWVGWKENMRKNPCPLPCPVLPFAKED